MKLKIHSWYNCRDERTEVQDREATAERVGASGGDFDATRRDKDTGVYGGGDDGGGEVYVE